MTEYDFLTSPEQLRWRNKAAGLAVINLFLGIGMLFSGSRYIALGFLVFYDAKMIWDSYKDFELHKELNKK